MTETKHTKHSNTSYSHFLSFYAHPHPSHYTSSHHTVPTLSRHHINTSASQYPSSSQHTLTLHTSPSPSPTSELEQSPQDCHHDEWHHPLSCKTIAHIASERTASTPTLFPSCLPKLSKLVKTHWTLILLHNLQGTVHNNCLQLQPTSNIARPSLQQSNTSQYHRCWWE